ncbi:hypothetical protein HDV05_001783 [Chytridiales sp. JEL 0842]|nr:hypothetical protein HDV05_001783 [Chytridiales sp. JEL 0842]
MEEFPRGGATSELSHLELRDAAAKADRDLKRELKESAMAFTSKKGSKKGSKKATAIDEEQLLFPQASEDLDIEGFSTRKQKRKKTDPASTAVDSKKKKQRLSGAADSNKTQTVNTLSFKRLNVGMTSLGIIKEINDLDLVVSLPNQLTGYVSITEISEPITKLVEKAAAQDDDDDKSDSDMQVDSNEEEVSLLLKPFVVIIASLTIELSQIAGLPSLSHLFTVGQPIQCVISSLNTGSSEGGEKDSGKKRIDLSIKPDLVNAGLSADVLVPGMLLSASVLSKEDHGYILDIGIKGSTGFLHKKNAQLYTEKFHKGLPLSVGHAIVCSVIKVNEGNRTVVVSVEPEIIAKTTISSNEMLSFEAVKCGMLTTCKVQSILEGGLLVSFMGSFEGTIDLFHLGLHGFDQEIDEVFKVGQKIQARVLHSDSIRKRVAFTLQPSFLSWSSDPSLGILAIDRGLIWEDAVIVKIDSSTGCILQCPNGSIGYLHVSRISDSATPSIDKKKHAIGTTHKVRVVGHDLCDGLVQLSMKPSILNAPFLRKDDVKPGMVVKGTIQRIESYGLLIALTDSIQALVPKIHMSETTVSNPGKLFKVGASVKAKVLESDAKENKLTLTLKKSLVNSQLPNVTSYSSVPIGSVVDGYVIAVRDFGCVIGFYGGVRAIAPISELSERYVKNPSDLFSVGQIVRGRIISIDPESSRMSFSIKQVDAMQSGRVADMSSVNVGDVLEGRILSILPDSALLELQPSLARGFLHKHHLSDHLSHADALFDRLQEGATLKDLVVLEKDEGRSKVVVSMKPLLVSYVKNEGKGAAGGVKALEAGDIVPGFVRSVSDTKSFFGFVGGLVGTATVQHIADGYLSKTSDYLKQGQTVLASVTSVDSTTGRMQVSLKPSQLAKSVKTALAVSAPNPDISFAISYFTEQDKLQFNSGTLADATNSKAWASKYLLGSVVKGSVKQKTPYGLIVDIDGGDASGLIAFEDGKISGNVGDKVECTVIDADFGKKILDLKFQSDLSINATNPTVRTKLTAAKEKNDTVDCVVLMVKSSYIVVSLPSFENTLAYAPIRVYNSACAATSGKQYKIGQTVKVNIAVVPSSKPSKKAIGYYPQRVLASINTEASSNVDNQAKKSKTTKLAILDPVDSSINSIEDLTIGVTVKGRIKKILPTQINVTLGSNLKGRVHPCEISSSMDKLKDPAHPTKGYKVGDTLSFKVVGFHESGKSHRFLPISHRNAPGKVVVELTLKEEDLELPSGVLATPVEVRYATLASLEVGTQRLGYIQKIESDSLWVSVAVGLLGRVTALEASSDLKKVQNISKSFVLGSAVTCTVLSKYVEKKELNLSLRAAENSNAMTDDNRTTYPLTASSLREGMKLVGRIYKVNKQTGLSIQLAEHLVGRVSLADISTEAGDEPTKGFEAGTFVECWVLSVNNMTGNVDLTLCGDAMKDSLEAGQVVSGYVKNVSDGGAFVDIGRNVVARVRIREISDEFVKDWKSQVEIGKKVVGKLLSVDEKAKRVEMSLKKSSVDPSAAAAENGALQLSDLSKGMKVSGTIKSIEPFGVFIKIDNSKLSGLCHISELSDKPVAKIESLYSPGDSVKAYIIKVDTEKRRISFGLKASYFDESDLDEDSDEEDDDNDSSVDGMEEDASDNEDSDDENAQDDNDAEVDAEEEDDDEEGDEEEGEGEEEDDEDEEGESEAEGSETTHDIQLEDNEAMDVDDDVVETSVQALEPLDLGGLGWGEELPTAAIEDDADSAFEDEGDKSNTKKNRRTKKREKREAEERLAAQEAALLESSAPDSADAFERLLVGSPSSSYLWIKFMAFHLQMAEIQKAREVAERALKTISFRESQERMNVWVALLNLENTFGDKESLLKTFQRAVSFNEPKDIYLQMAAIYERGDKIEELDTFYQGMVKRFKQSCKVWLTYSLSLLKRDKVEEARRILQRALQSLPKHKHIKMTSKFAQMEFRFGEPERGRTLFEGIVSHYPKRLDMWSIYLDMEAKYGDASNARHLFERAITLKLSSKKMKFLFKKYLEFEKKNGTPEGVEHVKEAAMEYVRKISEN